MRLDRVMLRFRLRIVDVGEDAFIELGASYRVIPSDATMRLRRRAEDVRSYIQEALSK